MRIEKIHLEEPIVKRCWRCLVTILVKAASNGMFLPGNKDKVKEMGLLGHWSNHKKYTMDMDKD